MAKDKKSLMMEFVTTNVVDAIIEETNVSVQDGMRDFYDSEVFDRLCDIETGLYRESGGCIYDLYKLERKHGRLIQCEM